MTLARLPAWTKILLMHEEGDSISKLSKKTGLQYDTVLNNVEEMSNKGLLQKTVSGREKNITLTLDGLLVKGAIIIIESGCNK